MKKNLKYILKSTGLQQYTIHLGTFDFEINCVVGKYENIPTYLAYKWEESEDWILKWNEELDKGYKPRGRWFRYKDYCPIIWIPSKPKTPREIATLAHEVLHVVYEVFRWATIPLSDDTEELRTHMQAYIITELLSKIK